MNTRTLVRLINWLLLATPIAVQGQFNYTTNNGTITITGYTGTNAVVVIPDTITDLPVTAIGYDAFYHRPRLNNVTIPNSVTSIGAEAFDGCTGLTNVTIGNGVTSIGDTAFYICTSLTSVAIPNSVTNIGASAFEDCTVLTNVTIGNGVTSIGDFAFHNCYNLTNVTIPNSVMNIGNYAFMNCFSLTNVIIPNGVTNVGDYAFFQCHNLTNVAIPNSVTIIGGGAFSSCYALTAITVDSANQNYSSIGGVLFDKGQTTLIQYPSAKAGAFFTIPDSVTSIGGYLAFGSCFSLTSVTIPNSVMNIGNYAFSACTNLTAVYCEGNAPSLGGSSVFSGDSDATVYYLPGTIGWGATFGGLPTAPWVLPNPTALNFGPSFGIQTNQFGFIVSWATNTSVAVEACTNLSNAIWTPVATNSLTNGYWYFTDPDWTNYPIRLYRIRSQ